MAVTYGSSTMHSLTNGNLPLSGDIVLKQEPDNVQPAQPANEQVEQSTEDEVLDITINNVVCSFSVRTHLNLRQIALQGLNVEYRRENGMVTMKLRRPMVTASIWSSGKITCTGATTEEAAKIAARRVARCLQKLGYSVQFCNFRIVNVLGTCTMPFGIKISQFSERHRQRASYEPELHPGVTYKMTDPKATLKVFSTGSVTITAAKVIDVQMAVEQIYPLVFEYQKERTKAEEMRIEENANHRKHKKRKSQNSTNRPSKVKRTDFNGDESDMSSDSLTIDDCASLD